MLSKCAFLSSSVAGDALVETSSSSEPGTAPRGVTVGEPKRALADFFSRENSGKTAEAVSLRGK